MSKGFVISPSRVLRSAGSSDGLAPSARIALEAMNEARAKIVADPHLSDVGRKAHLTEAAKVPLVNLRDRQRAIRERRKEIEAKHEKLVHSRAPVAATESEKREALMIWERYQAAARAGNDTEAERLLAVFRSEDPDPHTHRVQIAFQGLHPALVGPLGEQMQMVAARRLGLRQDLDPEAVELAEEAEALAEEDAQLIELRVQLLRACDRGALEASGFVPKKTATWTDAERRQFIDAHGAAAYRELLHDEMRQAMGIGQYEGLGPEPDEVAPPTDGVPPTTATPVDPSTLFVPTA